MSVNPLTPNLLHLLNPEPLRGSSTRLPSSSGDFSNIFTEALNAASRADTDDKVSTLELLMGESDDLAALMIDIQKAELSLNLALQIRNKLIDAYNEVMRMSV